MIIYNITITIDWSIHEKWLKWIKDEFISEMLDSKLFQKYQLVRLLQIEEINGPTYAIQFYAKNMEDYNRYLSELSETLHKKSIEKWGDAFIDFRTVMQVVD